MLLKDPRKNQHPLREDSLSCMKFIENERASARIKNLDVDIIMVRSRKYIEA